MSLFDEMLEERLASLRKQNLLRELRFVGSSQGPRISVAGRQCLNFSSNDYLALANHPALKEAAVRAIEQFGAGAGASRLVCGSLAPFHDLEESLADFKKTEAALTFSTGYAAAVGAITALVRKGDFIILDKLVHASIVDAARLSGAKLRVFDHNNLNDLEDKLKWASQKQFESRNHKSELWVITESVFSMDGDIAPLREIVALKEQYGAWFMVDEAHATGVVSACGRGLADKLGVGDQIDIQMGTLGKALGASGGYICGSRKLVDLLVNRARSFIFSTAPVPAAAAALAGIRIAKSAEGEQLRNALHLRIADFKSQIGLAETETATAIVPIILGDESKTLKAAGCLREKDIFVPAIRYPAVTRGGARLRITLTATHTAADISELADALRVMEILPGLPAK